MSEYTFVPAQEIKRIIASEGTILDVRNPDEHDAQHLLARHDFVPLGQLKPTDFMLRRGLDREAPVYLLCAAGTRAKKAAAMFAKEGYKKLYVIDGGITACAKVDGKLVSSGGSTVQSSPPKKPASPGGCA